MKHPIQPLEFDKHGTLRFKGNAIVRHLLDHGGIDLNRIATLPFAQEDRVQFAQLIGYSLSGFGELSYVSDEDFEAARLQHEDPTRSADAARVKALDDLLTAVRIGLREPIAALYGRHPDDLLEVESDGTT